MIRKNMIYIAIVVVLAFAIFPAATPRASAQEAAHGVFFLAREDSNGDGLLDESDFRQLWYFQADASAATILSQPDVDVLRYTVSPTAQEVAYLWYEGDNLKTSVVRMNNLSILTFDAFADLHRVAIYLTETGLWGIGLNADNIPVIRGINPNTGAVIIDKVTQYPPDSYVVMDGTGRWVMAFSPGMGALSVYGLPTLDSVPFEIWGYSANTLPVFSPTESNMLIGMRNPDDPNDLGAFVIDVSIPETVVTNLPDYPIEAQLEIAWSQHGRWITLHSPSESQIFVTPPQGTSVRVPLVTAAEIISGWSANDLYFSGAYIDETQVSRMVVHNVQSGEQVQLEALATTAIFDAEWHPTDDEQLAFIGQSATSGQYGVFLLNLQTGDVTPVFSTSDENVREGALRWWDDGSRLLARMPSGDQMLFTASGTPQALFVFDLDTDAVIRVSPENHEVLPQSMTVR